MIRYGWLVPLAGILPPASASAQRPATRSPQSQGGRRYDDPGWYDYPKGTVAYKVDGPPAIEPTHEHHGSDSR